MVNIIKHTINIVIWGIVKIVVPHLFTTGTQITSWTHGFLSEMGLIPFYNCVKSLLHFATQSLVPWVLTLDPCPFEITQPVNHWIIKKVVCTGKCKQSRTIPRLNVRLKLESPNPANVDSKKHVSCWWPPCSRVRHPIHFETKQVIAIMIISLISRFLMRSPSLNLSTVGWTSSWILIQRRKISGQNHLGPTLHCW